MIIALSVAGAAAVLVAAALAYSFTVRRRERRLWAEAEERFGCNRDDWLDPDPRAWWNARNAGADEPGDEAR
jgi:hypothetical protein